MARGRGKIYGDAVFIGILVCLVGLLLSQGFRRAAARIAGDFYHPFLEVPRWTGRSVADKSLLLKNKKDLVAALERAGERNIELSAELATLANLRSENEALRRLLDLGTRSGHRCVFAEIIIRDPIRWNLAFTINKGASVGVAVGAPVLGYTKVDPSGIYELALVGRVESVSRHGAIVNTILNNECRVGVAIPGDGVVGITVGGRQSADGNVVRLSYLRRDRPAAAGAPVFTSGFGGAVPEGLFLGRLASDAGFAGGAQLYREADMEPAADFETLRFVVVLVGVGDSGGRPPMGDAHD